MPAIDYKEELLKRLKDSPEECIGYLNAALDDEDPKVFLLALKDVIEATSSFSAVARNSNLNREHLYRMLSEDGNPSIVNILKLLRGIGFNVAIQTGDHDLYNSKTL